jgi:hypothetical protein
MPDVFVSPDQKTQQNSPSPLPPVPPETESQKSVLEGHTHSLFSAFSLYPDDIDFETREDGEKIILMLRRHPIVNILSILGIFSLLPMGFSLVITLAWYLLTSAYALEGFLSWYFNVYFVTTMRIVDINFHNLVNKKVSDAEVTKIQDVSYTSSGFLGVMFNFGNVFIQEFKFASVPSPEKVAKILDDFMVKQK